jgi:hypothetical protein
MATGPRSEARARSGRQAFSGTGLRKLTLSRFHALITAMVKPSSAISSSENCALSLANSSSLGSRFGMAVTISAQASAARSRSVLPVHVHAKGAAVDLRHAQQHQVVQAMAQQVLADGAGEGEQGLEGLGRELVEGNAGSVRHEVNVLGKLRRRAAPCGPPCTQDVPRGAFVTGPEGTRVPTLHEEACWSASRPSPASTARVVWPASEWEHTHAAQGAVRCAAGHRTARRWQPSSDPGRQYAALGAGGPSPKQHRGEQP